MATEHEAELRMETEMEQLGAKAEGRIRQERMNHDLILEKARADTVEKRDTVLRAIKDGGKLLSEGLASYVDDRDKLRNTALLLTAVTAGVYIRLTTGGGCGGWILCLTLCGPWGVFWMVI